MNGGGAFHFRTQVGALCYSGIKARSSESGLVLNMFHGSTLPGQYGEHVDNSNWSPFEMP